MHSSKSGSKSRNANAKVASLPLDIQRHIISKLSPTSSAVVGSTDNGKLNKVATNVGNVLRWMDKKTISVSHLTQLRSEGILGGLLQDYSDFGIVLIDEDDLEVAHVRMKFFDIDVYWNSPQHYKLEKFNQFTNSPYNKPGFNVVQGGNNKAYHNLLFALIIKLHYSRVLPAARYIEILTRFRKQDLLNAYPPKLDATRTPAPSPKVASPVSPRQVQQMQRLEQGARIIQEGRKKLKEHEKLYESLLTHSQAVRVFLQEKKKPHKTRATKRKAV